MMRRLNERELEREAPRRPGEPAPSSRAVHGGLPPTHAPGSPAETRAVTREPERAAALLSHVLRVLSTELTDEQLRVLRPELAHAIARGLWSEP